MNSLTTFWAAHGTKALGALAGFVAGVQTAAAIMTPNPLTPKQTLLLAGLNMAFAGWTVKRGFSNSAADRALDAPPLGQS